MSAPRGGSFATLLLSVPLAAIPLMAIFGIPEFATVSAETDRERQNVIRTVSEPDDSVDVGDIPAESRFRDRAADLFRPSKTATSQMQPQLFRLKRDDAAQWESQPSPRPMQTAAVGVVSDGAASQPVVSLPTTTAGLTWRDAARKLENVGITDYRLQRGPGKDKFLFVCRFSPGSDPRIVRRFEAQSSEPLEAVEDVLGQVDRWLQHRYAESRAWVSQ